ncbi:MAG: peroxiredoxin [Halodesulfurarchaeum sp.]
MLKEGPSAPGFTLPNQAGSDVAHSTFEGQFVVVSFYPRADTPGCTTEACSFRDKWGKFETQHVPVLGISDDPVEDLADFADRDGLPFDLLSDEDGSVARAYDSRGEKNVFGNEVEGTFRNTSVIAPDGPIAAVLEDVDPEEHATDVLEEIEAQQGT